MKCAAGIAQQIVGVGDAKSQCATRTRCHSVILSLLVGLIAAGRMCLAAPAAPGSVALERVWTGRPGPWGQLCYTRITIDPPDENLGLTTATAEFKRGRWVFKGVSREQVGNLLAIADLTSDQRAKLTAGTEWVCTPEATTLLPDRDLMLSLSTNARKAIYDVLVNWPENEAQTQPFVFRPELLNERLEKSRLTSETIAGFRRLLYPRGPVLVFADADAFMATIADRKECERFFQIISRRLTMLVKLKITPSTDIKQLDDYWSFPEQTKEFYPLFESLARVPDGCSIDIAHILPPFARKRVFMFPPNSTDTMELKRNCHWTAFNFFNDPPDDRFCDPMAIQHAAGTDYDRVTTASRLGDIIVLADARGDTVHSGVYIADDIAFTKNGAASSQPWVYMRISDMLDYYSPCVPPDQPLTVVVFRRKAH